MVTPMPNMTSNFRTESDIRVAPISPSCQSVVASKAALPIGSISYLLTGSYLQYGTNWKEYQFLAIADNQFNPQKSWTLLDADPVQKKKKQKNWYALML